jgi:ABC-type nitrate/sulfonate/bicarbonate transport system substrate-binding protein
VRTIFGGPELALALDRGALWIGEVGSPPGVTAIAHGAGFRIIASGEKRPALMYFALHQSIEAWSELRGERIGVLTTGSSGYWFLREILTHNGLDPDRDVEIVQLGKRYSDALQLIEDRMIEGALLVEPFLSTCVMNGTVRNWGSVVALDYIPPLQWSVQVARVDAIAEGPDTVGRILDAVADATRAAYGDVADYAAFLSTYLHIPLAVAQLAVERERTSVALDGALDLAGLNNVIALQTKLGAIPAGFQLENVIDRRFERGTVAANS